MKAAVIVDTGPLVALLNRCERHHVWCSEQFGLVRPPALTCESVISEACFLLRQVHGGVDALMQLLERRVLATTFCLAEKSAGIARLLLKYGDVPMSLADACLVRMSEQYSGSAVLTLDQHFRVYRKNGRQVIPTLMPQ